jgi:hypothetical protein
MQRPVGNPEAELQRMFDLLVNLPIFTTRVAVRRENKGRVPVEIVGASWEAAIQLALKLRASKDDLQTW